MNDHTETMVRSFGREQSTVTEAERARLAKLTRAADAAGCPRHHGIRAAAFDEAIDGVLIDAIDETVEHADEHSSPIGPAPAFRVLLSGPGVGKSVALTYACAWLGRPRGELETTYVRAETIAVTHRAMHDNRATWARWTGCDVLCIDELGLEEKPGLITELLLTRWDAGVITFAAGNMTADDFTTRYLEGIAGARLYDRIRGMAAEGLHAIVQSDAESRRGRRPAALAALGTGGDR